MNKNVIEPVAAEGTGTVNQEGDITMEKSVYTFRRLNSTDMFVMFKILGKIGINEFTDCFNKDSVKQMISKGATNDALTAVGISVVFEAANVLLGNLPKCESEIYQMLSQTSNLTEKEIRDMDMASFAEMVIDFIKKEEFLDFFKVVLKLFKPGK